MNPRHRAVRTVTGVVQAGVLSILVAVMIMAVMMMAVSTVGTVGA